MLLSTAWIGVGAHLIPYLIDLLTHPKVAEVIRKHQEARAKRFEITADRVVGELARIAFASVQDLLDDKGNWRHPRDMSPDLLAALSSIKRTMATTRQAR